MPACSIPADSVISATIVFKVHSKSIGLVWEHRSHCGALKRATPCRPNPPSNSRFGGDAGFHDGELFGGGLSVSATIARRSRVRGRPERARSSSPLDHNADLQFLAARFTAPAVCPGRAHVSLIDLRPCVATSGRRLGSTRSRPVTGCADHAGWKAVPARHPAPERLPGRTFTRLPARSVPGIRGSGRADLDGGGEGAEHLPELRDGFGIIGRVGLGEASH